ncbi:MAG: hypothetical protein ACT4O1_07070 [Gemmatimonadota bacterium]
MAKTQRKTAKRTATKPARVAVAPGNKKLSPRKAAKAAKGAKKAAAKKAPAKKTSPKQTAKKAPAKKAAGKKAPPRKAAPKKAAAKKVAPKKAAKKAAVKKAAPKAVKKLAPVKAAPPKKLPAPTPPAKAAKEPRPPKPAPVAKQPKPAPVPPPTLAPEAGVPIPVTTPPLGSLLAPPRKRGRKRRDPLDDLLKPEKKRGRPGRPRKRGGLAELMPKRPSRLKRRKGRRAEDEDADLPVAPRPPAPRDSMSLEEIRADVTARYLRGETPPCPVGCGGMAQVVRVSTSDKGAGEIWLECLSCAQRERFEVPAPTEQERAKVYATLDAGNEPTCPRHERYVPLRRRGRDLVCPECGILIPGR